MTSEGLVTTRVDPTDKRQRFVRITAKGRTLERTLRNIIDDALAPYMSGLTASEEQELLRLMKKAHGAVVAAAAADELEKPRARTASAARSISPRSRSIR
jgi:hypothetical protein